MYDLYIFDLGNVIITDVDVVPAVCDRLGPRADQFIDLYREHSGRLMTGEMDSTDFWSLLSGPPVGEDLLATCFKPKTDHRMVALLRHLRKQGRRVVCGTNTYQSHYDILKHWDLMNLFDRVYASHLIGLAKPERSFYQYIIDSENAAGRRIFFTDDLEENVTAASNCGIDAFLFTGPESLRDVIS
jgi:putative hydrolase of the HAD superfamily